MCKLNTNLPIHGLSVVGKIMDGIKSSLVLDYFTLIKCTCKLKLKYICQRRRMAIEK
jgi:hypothetical protein